MSGHEELIARLREGVIQDRATGAPYVAETYLLMKEAADALSKQGEENRRLREALEPFAEADCKATITGHPPFRFVSAGDYERAYEALHPKGSGGEEQGSSGGREAGHGALPMPTAAQHSDGKEG